MVAEQLLQLCEAVSRTQSIFESGEVTALVAFLSTCDVSVKYNVYMDLSKRALAATQSEEVIAILKVLLCLWSILSVQQRAMMIKVISNTLKRFNDSDTERFVYDCIAKLTYTTDDLLSMINHVKLAGLCTSPNGSKHRIRALLKLADTNDEEAVSCLINNCCSEIILYVHDQSSAVRVLGLEMLTKLLSFCHGKFPLI